MENEMKEIIQQAIEKSHQSLSSNTKMQIEEALLNLFEKNESPQKVFGIPDDVMENCYKGAYNLFKAGKYKEAIKIFESLRYLNPYDPRYSLAIAASFHYLKDYSKAAANYIDCKECDLFNPIPCFHLYDCFIKLDQPLLAVNAIAEVILRCQDIPQYKEMKEKALLEKENLIPYLREWLKSHSESSEKNVSNEIFNK